MKSEHRHELAENDLSKILARWGAEFDKHANTILTVLIVVALVAAGIIYWTRTTAATNALGWTDLATATSAEDYQTVAETYSGTPVAQWATLRAGDGFLSEGIRLSLTDRPASNERLAQAKESYQALLNNTSVPPEVRERALLGYAVTLESSSDGDTADVIAAYEQFLEEFPDSRSRGYAEDRIAELKTGGAQEFYAWFHSIEPKPPERPGPQDQIRAPDGSDLSDLLPELGTGGAVAPFEVPETGDGEAPADPNPFDEGEMKDEAPAAPGASEEGTAPEADAPSEPQEAPESQPPAETPESETQKPAQPASGEQPAPSGSGSAPEAESSAPAEDAGETQSSGEEPEGGGDSSVDEQEAPAAEQPGEN